MIAPPSPKVIFYRKLVPLKEYHNMMIPIAASVGIAGAFICGTVVLALQQQAGLLQPQVHWCC
jgi:hypothetical protein